MIEKIKSCFARLISSKQMRVGCVAVICAITVAVVTLLGCSIYTVNVFDGENTYTVRTLNTNIMSVISGVGLKSQNYKIEDTSVNGSTTSVKIAYTFPVYVTCGEKTTEIEFTNGTVADALKKAGYTVDEFDLVEPTADTEITDTIYIDYMDISYVTGNYTEKIPFSTETVYSGEVEKGVVKTLSAGVEGEKQVEYTEKLVNGESVEKTVTAETVLTKAVSAKKLVGTKVVQKAVMTSADVKSVSVMSPQTPIELDANGNPVKFKSKMVVRATAYTYTGNKCSTGVAPKPGCIAVNPNIIPYGTKMYIKSPDGSIIYGYAVAADTGGFIKNYPTGVDLFMTTESACRNFGVKNMEIYILE